MSQNDFFADIDWGTLAKNLEIDNNNITQKTASFHSTSVSEENGFSFIDSLQQQKKVQDCASEKLQDCESEPLQCYTSEQVQGCASEKVRRFVMSEQDRLLIQRKIDDLEKAINNADLEVVSRRKEINDLCYLIKKQEEMHTKQFFSKKNNQKMVQKRCINKATDKNTLQKSDKKRKSPYRDCDWNTWTKNICTLIGVQSDVLAAKK